MSMPKPKDRPSARELANGSDEPMQISGQPADICPYCGCAMFAYATKQPAEMITRYVECRNKSCGKKFVSRQPPATLVREVNSRDESSSGQVGLSVYGDVG